MPVYKNDRNGTWYAMVRYKDWTGQNKQKCQRGFATRREALEWEAQFKLQKTADIDMTLEAFYELYEQDVRPRLKENTWLTKQVIIEKKILPYLGKRKLSEITAKDVIDWQNTMMKLKKPNGEPLSQCYLKTIHAELSALFNHAAKYYQLNINPARNAGCMGQEENKEMSFWTKEEYLKFAEAIMDRPISYYAFEILYWCGIREGDADGKISLNQQKPSKHAGLRRFGPEKFLQRNNEFMKERPIFYKKPIKTEKDFSTWLRCFYYTTKAVITEYIYF